MDPDSALDYIRTLRTRITAWLDTGDEDVDSLIMDVDALLDTLRGLDEWLSNGGFFPSDWHANVRHS